jgi:hypothetical protein
VIRLIICLILTLCGLTGTTAGQAYSNADAGDINDGSTPGVTIPPRPTDALAGREFMLGVAKLSPAERDAAIRDELLSGNIPGFLRQFVTIHASASIGDDVEVTATYEVSADYLAVGSDDDFVRVPMTPMTAQVVADAFGCTLPTRKMVNDIYDQSAVKLAPLPLTEDRTSVTTFLQHNGLIEWQRQRTSAALGHLVAGIKKDVVVTNRLKKSPTALRSTAGTNSTANRSSRSTPATSTPTSTTATASGLSAAP